MKVSLACIPLATAIASCAYHGPSRTAIEAARVQLSRRGSTEAFSCDGTATKESDSRFEVTCGKLTTHVYCTSTSGSSCCVALTENSMWASAPGDNPMVCEDHRY
jgi:hypothetical protein